MLPEWTLHVQLQPMCSQEHGNFTKRRGHLQHSHPLHMGTLELCKCTEAPLAWLTCALFEDQVF